MTIRAILQTRDSETISIASSASVREAIALLAEKRIGALPVIDDGAVRGIFSERDVVYSIAKMGAAALEVKVGDVMTSPAMTVEPDSAVMAALSLMTRRRIRHLPVVDSGTIHGFVSIGDLVKYRIDKIESEAEAMREYIQSA
jgi:CBS domain-containing protein